MQITYDVIVSEYSSDDNTRHAKVFRGGYQYKIICTKENYVEERFGRTADEAADVAEDWVLQT